MIERVTIYRTTDGSEYRSIEKADAYESRVERLAPIMARLPQLPENDGCQFVNGHGYIQHDYETARAVMNDVLNLIEELFEHKWIDQTRAKGPREAHPSWVGRLISDYDDKALNRAWNRFMCIDWNTMREYGQPYYAAHPDKAAGGQINP